MADDTQARKRELEEIEKSITRSTIVYWIWQVSHWLSAGAIAICGFLSTSPGAHEGSPPPWYGTPDALVFYGLVGAVGGLFQDGANPGAKRERQHQKKFAQHLLKMALEGGRISPPQANRLRGMALTDPDKAIQELNAAV